MSEKSNLDAVAEQFPELFRKLRANSQALTEKLRRGDVLQIKTLAELIEQANPGQWALFDDRKWDMLFALAAHGLTELLSDGTVDLNDLAEIHDNKPAPRSQDECPHECREPICGRCLECGHIPQSALLGGEGIGDSKVVMHAGELPDLPDDECEHEVLVNGKCDACGVQVSSAVALPDGVGISPDDKETLDRVLQEANNAPRMSDVAVYRIVQRWPCIATEEIIRLRFAGDRGAVIAALDRLETAGHIRGNPGNLGGWLADEECTPLELEDNRDDVPD